MSIKSKARRDARKKAGQRPRTKAVGGLRRGGRAERGSFQAWQADAISWLGAANLMKIARKSR